MKLQTLQNQINSSLTKFCNKVILLLSLTCFLIAVKADAKRWTKHSSEVEVYEQIYTLLLEAELPPNKIKRGSYPLY